MSRKNAAIAAAHVLVKPGQVLGRAKNFLAGHDTEPGIAIIAEDLVALYPVVVAVFWPMDMVALKVKQIVVRVAVFAADPAACIDVKICIYHGFIVTNIL